MNLSLKSAIEVDVKTVSEMMTEGYSGYIGGSFSFDSSMLQNFIENDGTSLQLSQILFNNEQAIGLALIARRGWTNRLAALGIIPEMRRQGAGRWLMSQMIEQAGQRRDRFMVLECIEQNIAALNMYKSLGFESVRRLYGYSVENPEGTKSELEEVDIFEVGKLLTSHDELDLPWQCSGMTIARSGPPQKAMRLGNAYAVISSPARQNVMLRALVVHKNHQGQGQAKRLVRALFAKYPDKTWKISAICPEEIGERVFEKVGFVREAEINQFQMCMALDY
jgi:ribosomal protein S18 acetylase RimI-like enzyme